MEELTPTALKKILDADTAAVTRRPVDFPDHLVRKLRREPLFQKIGYDDLSSDCKLFLAKYFLTESCHGIGGCASNGDLFVFLSHFARELASASDTPLFGMRSKEPIAFALQLVASSRGLDPAGAVGSVYLCIQIELFFRRISGFLKADGTWVTPALRTQADNNLDGKMPGYRVNSVALAYKLLLLNTSSDFADQFRELEAAMPTNSVVDDAGAHLVLNDIGERIQHLRHHAAHGFWSDLSSEGPFYGLLYAVIFFCSQSSAA